MPQRSSSDYSAFTTAKHKLNRIDDSMCSRLSLFRVHIRYEYAKLTAFLALTSGSLLSMMMKLAQPENE